MGRLSHAEALKIVAESGNSAKLAEAVGSLGDDPATKPEELLPALHHGGYIAEQAAMILHQITRTPPGHDGKPITSQRFWQQRLDPEIGQLYASVPFGLWDRLSEILARESVSLEAIREMLADLEEGIAVLRNEGRELTPSERVLIETALGKIARKARDTLANEGVIGSSS